MEETATSVSNTSTTTPSTHSNTARQTTTSPTICIVCGAPALYSYYGAIVCHSCKVFFRRNAKTRSVPLTCNYDGHCEIDVNNRRVCPSCRLAKCFASGMSAELIRPSHAEQTETNRTRKSTSTALVGVGEMNQIQQIPTLNLLQADQSTLSVDQWNHLSNLVHCFDEYCGLQFIQNFIQEQTALPPKFRFKCESVNKFFTSMMTTVQLVFEKNREFLSLSLHDRTVLLRNTVEYTTSIGGAFILRQVELFDQPTFYKSAEIIFRPTTVALIKRLIDQLDPDITFMKIIFAIIAFFMSNYTVYTNTIPDNLIDAKSILHIQDMYTELVWRYLIYKHNFQDAVLRFSNFVRCLLLVNDSVVEAHEVKEFTDMMDSVVEQTEQKINLNS